MRRYELGMSLNYARSWGVSDAVREFFQNALDQQRLDPGNAMFFEYNAEDCILKVGNKHSKLTPSTLLMGSTSKADNPDMIGEHGEGYKVATVVLMRNGVSVKVYNNEAKEVWESKIVKSKRYGADIVVFDVSKKVFQKECDLVIELEGITREMYNEIISKNLNLQTLPVDEVKVSENGRVLLNEKYRGHVYVDGLYVCTANGDFKFGYDMKPNLIRLDRDRSLVDNFDLRMTIAKVVSKLEDASFIAENIDTFDFSYIGSYLKCSFHEEYVQEVSDMVYEDLEKKYGKGVIPTSNYKNFNYLKTVKGANVVFVSPQVENAVNIVDRVFPSLNENLTLEEEFKMWYDEAIVYLPEGLSRKILDLWNRR